MSEFIEREISGTTRFLNSVRQMLDNTFNFENCSFLEKYKNTNMEHMEETTKGLIYFRNIIQEKYYRRLIETRIITNITDEQRDNFDMNPYLAASELLGNRDYWWLILLVNKKLNIESFTKLKSFIYTPDMSDIKESLIKELSKTNDLGKYGF